MGERTPAAPALKVGQRYLEKLGAQPQEVRRLDARMRIPTKPGTDSDEGGHFGVMG